MSEVAYQNAAVYARERLQGRALTGPRRRQAGRPIIVHPDVRRMLMTIRAFNEAARALVMWTALRRRHPPLGRCQGAAGFRRSHGPVDAGAQGRAYRSWDLPTP